MIELDNRRPLFRKQRARSNPTQILIILGMIIAALYLLRGYQRGEVGALFAPTPTPTRVANSYAMEGEAQFIAGNLPRAIEAYKKGVELDPQNAILGAELARIQTYYSGLSTTDAERKQRLLEARASIDQAVSIAPDNSQVQAIRAFVYDWNSNSDLFGEEAIKNLTEAEQSVIRALQLDSQNALALAYYAEILVDQQKWLQAEQNIEQALARDDTLMDVHRVSGYVQESLGNYQGAIEEYRKALAISPKFTPLLLRIGTNYRTLGLKATTKPVQDQMYELALEAYAEAVQINKAIGAQDPTPYISIAKTYSQMGEFFVAALNVRTALDMLPENPDMYGQLGVVYFKARNYESAIPALQCVVKGCDSDVSCEVRNCNPESDTPITIEPLPLSSTTLIYYYTYGSVLAGMHRPGRDYCAGAVEVLSQVRANYSNDPEVMAIITPSEQICESYGYSAP